MSTPTPRTDEARRIDNGDTHPLLDDMETMERELAIERGKVRVLREACIEVERYAIEGSDNETLLRAALVATKDKP